MKSVSIAAGLLCRQGLSMRKTPPAFRPNTSFYTRRTSPNRKRSKTFNSAIRVPGRISEADGKPALELTRQSNYKPAVRSPFNIALLTDKGWGDVIFEADCQQTGKEYGHRDMVFVYGYQDPSHFYYTHIATAADDHAHNCFIVNAAPRVKFASEVTKGVNWGLGVWHHVRIVRKASDGTVRVYFDDMEKPDHDWNRQDLRLWRHRLRFLR